MKKNNHLSESTILKELHSVISNSPKFKSAKTEKMMKIKDEVESKIKEWGWVK